MRVARVGVDLVPPAQAHEPAARNVLEVVEVAGEEEDGDDEDHDTVVVGGPLAFVPLVSFLYLRVVEQ